MTTANAKRVIKYRKTKGNALYSETYHKLRTKYNIPSVQANKMKTWSYDKIILYLEEHNIEVVDNLKVADRL